MPSLHEAMQQINNVRSNAQTSLPFIPNNGNPNGANNMRSAMPEDTQTLNGRYSWLQPSPHMNAVTEMLNKPLMVSSAQDAIPMPKPQLISGGAALPYGTDGYEPGMVASPTNNYTTNPQKEPTPILPVNGNTGVVNPTLPAIDINAMRNDGIKGNYAAALAQMQHDGIKGNFAQHVGQNLLGNRIAATPSTAPVIPIKYNPPNTINPGKPTIQSLS